MKKVFITGGAGYIGTTLIPLLLSKGYQVTVYDSLLFNNGDKMIPFLMNDRFNFIRGDVRDDKLLREHMQGFDVVIHLAALVGYQICRERGEEEAQLVNTEGTRIVAQAMHPDQYLLFGSTGSNYGEVKGICTEETPLNPLSIYGRTKTRAEEIVMKRPNSTAYRFATAFGLSPRLRLDLLINDLTFKAVSQGYAVIYESHFLRTFIHVRDIASSFAFAIEHQDRMRNNIYNVGSNQMNYSKREVCEKIKLRVKNAYFNYADVGEDVDKRNYQVSYEKIEKLGFQTTLTVDQGIDELVKAAPIISISSPYHNGFV